jgi:hypothetical protein
MWVHLHPIHIPMHPPSACVVLMFTSPVKVLTHSMHVLLATLSLTVKRISVFVQSCTSYLHGIVFIMLLANTFRSVIVNICWPCASTCAVQIVIRFYVCLHPVKVLPRHHCGEDYCVSFILHLSGTVSVCVSGQVPPLSKLLATFGVVTPAACVSPMEANSITIAICTCNGGVEAEIVFS